MEGFCSQASNKPPGMSHALNSADLAMRLVHGEKRQNMVSDQLGAQFSEPLFPQLENGTNYTRIY